MSFFFEEEDIMVGKGENAGDQHDIFRRLLTPHSPHPKLLKIGIVW